MAVTKKNKYKQWLIGGGVLVVLLYVLSPMLMLPGIEMGMTSRSSYGVAPSMPMAAPEKMTKGMMAEDSYMPSPMSPIGGSLGDLGSVTERKVVKNGALSLFVASITESFATIDALAVEQKGFVESVSEYGPADQRNGSVTLRVPATNFDVTRAALKEFAIKTESEQVTTSDVTEQHIDLEARLKNAKSEEEQYRAILKQATKIDDILNVTRQLTDVRTRIDQLQGQLNYLSRQVDMSTITVSLREEAAPGAVGTEWRPLTIVKAALRGLAQGIIDMVNIIVVTIIWLPLFALWIGLAFLIGWLVAKLVRWIKMRWLTNR